MEKYAIFNANGKKTKFAKTNFKKKKKPLMESRLFISIDEFIAEAKTKTITLYEFDELPEKTQAKVLDKYRYMEVENHDWYEHIFETSKEKLEKLGFLEPEIHFSGFSSQGDGACFDAKIDYELWVKNTKQKLEPSEKRMLTKNKDLIVFTIEKNSYGHHYSHSNTRYVDFDGTDDSKLNELLDKVSDLINKDRKELSDEIYKELEKEYDGLTSDEYLKEIFKSNEYTFNSKGEIEGDD